MEQETLKQFRDEEITILSHWDKQTEQWIKTVYPKVGGRLRLAHEQNEQLSITTEIIRYDEQVAVVRAVAMTAKGAFNGIGMASMERDNKVFPAILELAETRSIARSLRFAGYGVEYCSAEEVSHLENGNGKCPQPEGRKGPPEKGNGNGSNNRSQNGGNGDTPSITDRQLTYIRSLAKTLNYTWNHIEQESATIFGKEVKYLSMKDGSALIEILKGKSQTNIYN